MKNGFLHHRKAPKSIADRFGLDLIVLFGSRARGQAGPESDTDVAVRRTRRAGRGGSSNLFALDGDLAKALRAPRGIDLVELNRASPLLQFCVARDGVLLYECRRGEFARFRLYAARRFDDNRKFYDLLDRHLQRRLA